MKIIALFGLSNTGKTTTIKLVYNMVLQQGGMTTQKKPLGGDPNDFLDIVLWKNIKIVFFSMGDNSTALANAIYNYREQNCDLMICSLSIGTPKVRANNALNRFNATRINKTIVSQTNLEINANMNDAQTIFNLI